MKAVIYFSLSKKKMSEKIAKTIEGDHFALRPADSVPKFYPFQLIKLGFATLKNKSLPVDVPKINYDLYDEIVLVFPIWAGRMAQYMKSFVDLKQFTNKKVTLIASSGSGSQRYKQNLENIVDQTNEVVDIVMYKGTQLIM